MERLADYPADRLTRRRFLSGPAERSSKMRIRSTGRGTCSSGAATTPPLFQADRWHLQKKKRIEKGSSSSNTLSLSLSLVSFFSYLTVRSSSRVDLSNHARSRIYYISRSFLRPFNSRINYSQGGGPRETSKRFQTTSKGIVPLQGFLCKRFLIKRGNVPSQINSTRRLVGFDFGSPFGNRETIENR